MVAVDRNGPFVDYAFVEDLDCCVDSIAADVDAIVLARCHHHRHRRHGDDDADHHNVDSVDFGGHSNDRHRRHNVIVIDRRRRHHHHTSCRAVVAASAMAAAAYSLDWPCTANCSGWDASEALQLTVVRLAPSNYA